MKKFKKFLALFATAAMVVGSLAGCGGSGDDASDAGTTTDAATFKIGGIGPTTGGAALYGIAVKQGAELAVKEINEAGGINGVQIEFQMEDDEHDAEKAVNAYNNLKDWGMQMLMGTVTSAPCTAVVEKTYEDNMFQLTPSGSSVASISHENAYRVCYSDPNQGLWRVPHCVPSPCVPFRSSLGRSECIPTGVLYLSVDGNPDRT